MLFFQQMYAKIQVHISVVTKSLKNLPKTFVIEKKLSVEG